MIDTGEIAVLAGLYDRYANAFERTSLTASKLAGSFMRGSKCSMSRRAGMWPTMPFVLKWSSSAKNFSEKN